ncbi:T6SS immunity protein Tli4 family protein [Acinetobacter nematophilus]|uniref:T6SS immunity protein Tli4 family protein n=1 Tax=Acinetobacter nematophilus TaxID=2994642 RepID=A0A9X3IFU6_9GAMM|nr:T6SS immunity protein Tli4 family protein [Acinetobacter nematophilus]MCX5467002.1 T6SS immunity protein Tli4 family protein [Acinetobacter nematophilus]
MINFKDTKNICLGRIEFTVPKETDVKFGTFSFDGSDFKIAEEVTTLDQYDQFIKDKIQTLKQEKHETEGSLLKLEKMGSLKLNQRSISHIIVYRPTEYTDGLFFIDAFIYLNRKLIRMKSPVDTDKLMDGLRRTENIIQNFKLKPSKGPNQAGLCWKDYFIADDMTENRFFLSEAFLSFPSYPEVTMNIENRARVESDTPLIQMIRKNKAGLPKETLIFKEDVIREHAREINGLKGEEVMTHYQQRLSFGRGFESGAWQYLGTLDDPTDSYIYLGLESVDKVNNKALNAPLNQKIVLGLNDFVLNNIKISTFNQGKQHD